MSVEREKTLYKDKIYIYSWGRNKNGELGNGTFTDCLTPTPSKLLHNKIIIEISSGGKHSLILTNDNIIHSCGSAEFGVLGNYNNNKMKSHPLFEAIESLQNKPITSIACAEFHSLCLTKEGLVCSWGGNLYNKLGQQNALGTPLIIKSLSSKKVTQISCGEYHSIILTNQNEVYTWGGGGQYNHGQCGIGKMVEINTPTQISFFTINSIIPIKVKCGGYHTLILCLNNEIYAFGKGDYGQCGIAEKQDILSPLKVIFENEFNEYKEEVKDISCGGEHSAIITKSGKLYTFGHGYNGQLGHGNNLNCLIPTLVKSCLKVKVDQVACGWSHTLILTNGGFLYSTGCNVYGELGLNDTISRNNFVIIKEMSKLNVNRIFCGGHHSWVVLNKDNPIKDKIDNYKHIEVKKIKKEEQKKKSTDKKNVKINKIKGKSYNIAIKSSIKCNLEQMCFEEGKVDSIEKNDTILPLSSRIHLKILYTNLPFNKKIVRFYLNYSNYSKNYNSLCKILSQYFDARPQIISHSLIEASKFIQSFSLEDKYIDFDEIEKSLTSEYQGIKSTYDKEYILTMTCSKISSIKEISAYMKILTLDDIQREKKEEYLSEWVLDFLFLFKDIIELNNLYKLPSFIEFR